MHCSNSWIWLFIISLLISYISQSSEICVARNNRKKYKMDIRLFGVRGNNSRTSLGNVCYILIEPVCFSCLGTSQFLIIWIINKWIPPAQALHGSIGHFTYTIFGIFPLQIPQRWNSSFILRSIRELKKKWYSNYI